MAPVPIHSASPITGDNASGVTPQTSQPDAVSSTQQKPPTTTASGGAGSSYPAAQPGARPPAPTGASQPPLSDLQPTPTRTAQSSGPPPPQPGAVPVPPSTAAATVPPPPKAGEKFVPQQSPAPTVPMPPQMAYPPPSQPLYGSITSTAPQAQGLAGPGPTVLPGNEGTSSYEHPPGYQQDANASEMTAQQGLARDQWIAQQSRNQSSFEAEGEEGVWGTAKKWAVAAGDSLAAAENEVWKRINKD